MDFKERMFTLRIKVDDRYSYTKRGNELQDKLN